MDKVLEQKAYAYWLMKVQGFGRRMQRHLFNVFRSAREIHEQGETGLSKVPGLTEADVVHILQAKEEWNEIEQEFYRLMQTNIRFLCWEEEEYPQRLRNIQDSPYGLFYKGSFPGSEEFRVAIVGARMCSEYGRSLATELARELALRNVPIVSGMARGIDAAGHRGALDAPGMTYAVFGCGVDVCYPNYHRTLYYEIESHGGLLSEYLPGTKPLPAYFPMRNRIISALSDVVLVIEAKQKSGSLITADFAIEQGKGVYALPGRVSDTLSYGCNRLISQGAGIILSVEDLLEELALEASRKEKKYDSRKKTLEKGETLVYSCLGLLPVRLEEILSVTGLDLPTVSRILTGLVQKDYVEEVFKNYYKIVT